MRVTKLLWQPVFQYHSLFTDCENGLWTLSVWDNSVAHFQKHLFGYWKGTASQYIVMLDCPINDGFHLNLAIELTCNTSSSDNEYAFSWGRGWRERLIQAVDSLKSRHHSHLRAWDATSAENLLQQNHLWIASLLSTNLWFSDSKWFKDDLSFTNQKKSTKPRKVSKPC